MPRISALEFRALSFHIYSTRLTFRFTGFDCFSMAPVAPLLNPLVAQHFWWYEKIFIKLFIDSPWRSWSMSSLQSELFVWHSNWSIKLKCYNFIEGLMEFYNYDTLETESVDIADLTESNVLFYIPAWKSDKAHTLPEKHRHMSTISRKIVLFSCFITCTYVL